VARQFNRAGESKTADEGEMSQRLSVWRPGTFQTVVPSSSD
jgi:hypothetical protein